MTINERYDHTLSCLTQVNIIDVKAMIRGLSMNNLIKLQVLYIDIEFGTKILGSFCVIYLSELILKGRI
jgi:hypothetical protein